MITYTFKGNDLLGKHVSIQNSDRWTQTDLPQFLTLIVLRNELGKITETKEMPLR